MPYTICPECESENRLPSDIPNGKRIRCGECQEYLNPGIDSAIRTLSRQEANAFLKQAGTLSDPAKVCGIYFSALALIVFSFSIMLFGPLMVVKFRELDKSSVLFLAFGLQIIALPIAVWLVFRPVFAKPVFYLRAFRSDRAAEKLRMLIRAGIGQEYRLSGIRPPSCRVSWWSRLLFTTSTGFRYIQSNEFEMEAPDHNWMARLLSSYSKSPFVFIDVRDITVHVEDEIRLSYLAMGSDRSLFITDPTGLDEEKWKTKIGDILGISNERRDDLCILSYPGDASSDCEDFVRDVDLQMLFVPKSLPDVTAAVEFARSRVSAAEWATPFYEKAGVQFFGGIAAVFILQILAIFSFGESGYLWLWLVQVVGIVIYFASTLIRGWKIALTLRRFQKPVSTVFPNPLWRPLAAILLSAYAVTLPVAMIFVPPAIRMNQGEKVSDSLGKMRKVDLGLREYSADYGAYPSALKELVPDFLEPEMLISPFAPDDPQGYKILPGVSPSSPGETILLEDIHAPALGFRVVMSIDGHGRRIPLKGTEAVADPEVVPAIQPQEFKRFQVKPLAPPNEKGERQ